MILFWIALAIVVAMSGWVFVALQRIGGSRLVVRGTGLYLAVVAAMFAETAAVLLVVHAVSA